MSEQQPPKRERTPAQIAQHKAALAKAHARAKAKAAERAGVNMHPRVDAAPASSDDDPLAPQVIDRAYAPVPKAPAPSNGSANTSVGTSQEPSNETPAPSKDAVQADTGGVQEPPADPPKRRSRLLGFLTEDFDL